MSNSDPRASLSGKRREAGATLAELLVVMTIVAILAVVTVPMAEVEIQRKRESDLRQTLREVRTAIDRMHEDWRSGLIAQDAEGVSENGYPETLAVLVEGIEAEEGAARRYLRALPVNAFARTAPAEEQWRLLAYEDGPEAETWSGTDVYDLRARTEKTALDGTQIATW